MEFVPEFVPPSHSVPILCLLLGLSATCYLLWQLWWPSFDSAAAAKATLVPPLSSWGAARVVAFLSANTDLELVRGRDAHFFRSNFSNVDGEMLLDMTNEDFVSKGVKPYHLMKIKRVLADIALENSRDGKGIVMRAIDPLRSCQDQANTPALRPEEAVVQSSKASSKGCIQIHGKAKNEIKSIRNHQNIDVTRRRSSSPYTLSAPVEDKLRTYLSQQARKDMRRMTKFKAAVDSVRANLSRANQTAAKGKEKGTLKASTTPTSRTSTIKASNRSRSASTRKTQKSAFRVGDKTRWLRGEVIGVGAFGRVYFGLSEKTGVMMAVKEIRCPDDAPAEELEGLVSEISMLKKLVHENIVGYLGARIERSHFLYIFTQWVPGGSIESLLERFGALTQSMVMNYTVQILRGLEYLHGENVVHRDIKSANILVDENGVIKLSDFGTCKRLQEIDRSRDRGYNPYNLMEQNDGGKQLRKKHSFAGTPFYMAPEVMLQEAYDQSADIWSVGCTVLHMSTNEQPWKEKNFRTIPQLMLHLKKTHQAPAIPLRLGDSLRKFMLRCFIRNQEDRPTASRLLKDPFLADSYLIKGRHRDGDNGNSSSTSSGSSSSDEDNMTMQQMRRKINTQRHGGGMNSESKEASKIQGQGGFPRTPRGDYASPASDNERQTAHNDESNLLCENINNQASDELDTGNEYEINDDNPHDGNGGQTSDGTVDAGNPFGGSGNLTRHGSSLAREMIGDGDGNDGQVPGGSVAAGNPFGGSGNLTRHGSSLAREMIGDGDGNDGRVSDGTGVTAANPLASYTESMSSGEDADGDDEDVTF